jgi:hypothetical protein
VNDAIGELAYPMAELSTFLQGSPDSKLDERDAAIFHFYLRSKLQDLISMAREIDAGYEEPLD